MDNETKILLNRLIEEVEKLNSPDWWIIGITIVNALIMVWLGWRQYKLQLQQTKIQKSQLKVQEYNVYRQLYSIIKKSNEVIENQLNIIYNYFSNPLYRIPDDKLLYKKEQQLKQLEKDLYECSIDFELKISKKEFDVSNYMEIIAEMNEISQLFRVMEITGGIAFVKNDKYAQVFFENKKIDDENLVNALLEQITDDDSQKATAMILGKYISQKKEILAMNIADKIKERIILENDI